MRRVRRPRLAIPVRRDSSEICGGPRFEGRGAIVAQSAVHSSRPSPNCELSSEHALASGCAPPSDTNHLPIFPGFGACCGAHELLVWVVSEPQAKLLVGPGMPSGSESRMSAAMSAHLVLDLLAVRAAPLLVAWRSSASALSRCALA